MNCYSDRDRDRDGIYVKGYVFFCLLLKNMGINIAKNVDRNLSSKYSQKALDYAKECATDAFDW